MHSLQMLRVSYKNHHTFSSVLTVTIVVHGFFGSIITGAHTYNCFVWVFLARGYLDQKLLLFR